MKIALDRQHYGKPAPYQRDCGAEANGVRECEWTAAMIDRAEDLLEVLGHRPILLPDPVPQTYGERHAAARAARARLYVACHANSFPGVRSPYCLVEYIDPQMERFARVLARGTGELLDRPWKIQRMTPESRGWECIDGVAAIGVLFEPFFLQDRPLARDPAGTARRAARAVGVAVRRVYGCG